MPAGSLALWRRGRVVVNRKYRNPVARMKLETISREQADQFMRDGYCLFRNVFSREVAAAVRRVLWEHLEWSETDPDQWPESFLIRENILTPETARVPNDRYHRIVADLLGKDRFPPLLKGIGYSPIRFPVKTDRWQATGWHVDGAHFHHHLTSPEQGLVGVDLFSDIDPEGGGTAIRVGSHKPTAKLLAAAEPQGLSSKELSERARELARDLPVIEAIGQAGDIVIMHPFTVHGSSTNRSHRVRLASNRCISLKAPLSYDRADGDYSVVERAVLDEVRAVSGA